MHKYEQKKPVPVLNSMEKTRNTHFLKNYTLNYTNSAGEEKIYEMVSNFDYESPEEIGKKAAGVVIAATKGDKLLLCKEYRMGVHSFVYNMPAGHIDDGEDPEQCARRELYEETGLSITEIIDVLPPSFASPDLSDSSAWIVIAKVDGEIADHTEPDEWIQPGFYSKEEVDKMIRTETFSARAQLIGYYLFCFNNSK